MPCRGPIHFSFTANYLYECCPLPDPDVGNVRVCDVEHTSFHFWSVQPQVCSVLPLSVSRSLHHCRHSWQHRIVFRQMARLLLKRSRCLAYAIQLAMILRCTSWLFSLGLYIVVPNIRISFNIFFQHIAHVD